MEYKCSKCGGDLITGHLTTGAQLVGFTPLEDEKKFKPRHSLVLCDTCTKCGNISNIRAEEPEKLR